jgi:hypothetical protein
MEKPKTTHKMVRRISFMRGSFRLGDDGEIVGAVDPEPDPVRHCTMGDTALVVRQPGRNLLLRHVD